MKTFNILAVAASLLAGFGLLSSSCDAVWDASFDDYPYYGDYYGAGIDNDWYPSLPGAPLISPVYWGGALYPGSTLPPMRPTRPGWNSGPVWNAGSGNIRPGNPGRPVPLPEGPSGEGNVRPGQTTTPLPDVPSSSGNIRPSGLGGGNPGIALPPEGMGYRTTRH